MSAAKEDHILWFSEICVDDVGKVGGKSASLGEMYRELSSKNIAIPNGFAITAQAYFYFIDTVGVALLFDFFFCSHYYNCLPPLVQVGIREEIASILSDLDVTDMDNLVERGDKVCCALRKLFFWRTSSWSTFHCHASHAGPPPDPVQAAAR